LAGGEHIVSPTDGTFLLAVCLKVKVKKSKEGYSSLQASLPSPLRELTCHKWDHTVLPAGRGYIPAFTPAEAGTRFSEMQG